MKVIVPIKRVIDYKTPPRLKSDGSRVDESHAKMVMNPFDEIALEEAIRWREQGIASEIVLVSIGPESVQEVLRAGLAMGADRAILIKAEQPFYPLMVAKVLKTVILQENAEIVILGKQSVDGDNNQVGQMLSALLDWPQACFASKVVFDQNKMHVTREIDGGLETLELSLPCVITTDLRLNEPRYTSLPNIMLAKRKPLQHVTFESLDVTVASQIELLKVQVPTKNRACKKLVSSEELLACLRKEAKAFS